MSRQCIVPDCRRDARRTGDVIHARCTSCERALIDRIFAPKGGTK